MEIIGGTLLQPLVQHQEAIKAPHGSDHPRDRPRREPARALASHELFERVAIEASRDRAGRLGVRCECGEVARVTLERVLGESPLHAEMVEIGINHRRW